MPVPKDAVKSDKDTPGADPEFDPQQLLKMAIEIGPIILFGLTYWGYGLFYATGVLIGATLASLIASKIVLGSVAVMPIVTAVIVTLFGGLTLWLQDLTFIKMKPTIIYVLFAGGLVGGLMTGRNFLSHLFGQAFDLTPEGWRILTLRWAMFFLAMAVVNELVWRNFSELTWVNFKLFGFIPLTLAFAAAQIGLLKRYAAGPDS